MSTDSRHTRVFHILPDLGGIEDPVTSEPSDNQKTSPNAYRKYGDAKSAANSPRELCGELKSVTVADLVEHSRDKIMATKR